MADTQLSSGIQCLIGGHDPTPVFPRKGGKIIGLYTCKSTFIQLLRTVFDVVFHFFLGWCFQYGRIKLYCILLQKSGIQVNLLLNLRELRDFFRSSRPQLLHTATCPQTRTIMMGISVESASSSSLCG